MKRILVVDDSGFMRRILKGHLSKERAGTVLAEGCVVLEAGSKEDALREFQQGQPDLVMLDIVMDGGERDGIEVLGAIMRADPRAKVIMMSAVGQDKIMRECMSMGATGYILKPFDEAEVVTAVDGALTAGSAAAARVAQAAPRDSALASHQS